MSKLLHFRKRFGEDLLAGRSPTQRHSSVPKQPRSQNSSRKEGANEADYLQLAMSSIDRESDHSEAALPDAQSSVSKVKQQRPHGKPSDRKHPASQHSAFRDSSDSSNSGSSLYDHTATRDVSGSFFSAKADGSQLNLAKLHSLTTGQNADRRN